ncbi:EpsG family protein [Ferviditalea candida]|uniref:EpsG family protein n=1 Tax=Ferviditalea candida TaxID=3108399 RepID=A0ABU5ZE63_9BACL|nr:EpsG family protein [Paenibacillaceae bacterium T2]
MTVFWLTLFTVFILSLMARYLAKPVPSGPGPVYIQPNRYYVFLVMAVLILVSGLRSNIGDTFFYMYSYKLKPLTLADIGFSGDFGFNLLQMLLQQFTADPQYLIFWVALFTNALIIPVLYKYSSLFELSVFLYITTGMYLTSMNGIRQFLAASIIFAATKYIFEGNWKKYFAGVLLASTIHQSALILIPVYFIVRQKAWTRQTLFLLLAAIFIVVGFNQFSHLLYSAIQDTRYSQYRNLEQHGANMMRAVVAAIPLILAYLGRERLRGIFPKSDYIVNMCLINLMVMMISTQQWIFARFSFYFGLYELILIPWLVKLFVPKDQKLIYYTILISYFLYYFYENVISLNIYYQSHFFKI